MKYQLVSAIAAATSLWVASSTASPLNILDSVSHSAMSVRSPNIMTLEDRFSNSGLEYMEWANLKVAEGKMYWPNKTSITIGNRQTGSFTLMNIACGVLGGTQQFYEDGEAHFCTLVNLYVGGVLKGAEWLVNDLVCQDQQPCLLLVEIGLDVGGGFAASGVPSFCSAVFEEIYASCNGAPGGAGQIFITDDSGSQSGVAEAQFFGGESDTCPATDDTFACGASLGN
ncbi:hypothetical protein GLAREA_10719 [Glarea lozoyensis ATCC 20868]|uniref:Uncharacterized protein n=1 Tax=Glarea lozoyensis (strain ATCC 20868 / MF5171) TaxID=1116229 RepID=S3DD44_GLAL2|nr:uncharacterized protein GLAREA_10719 [Glarea lozoyensis ATCC 20868]EPE35024.1 hypothetical protein GLAREA_10719 [Glarea lozoyensis ATCC 20868]